MTAILDGGRSQYQIPQVAGQSPTLGLTVNGASDFPSALINENRTQINNFGILAYQKRVGDIDFQIAGFSRYSSQTASRQNWASGGSVTLDSTPKAERSHYFDVGATQIILPGLKAGVDAYYKIASDLIDEGQFGAPVFFTPFNYQKGMGQMR